MTPRTRLVLFGTGPIAEVASVLFTHDSEYEVVGFTVDAPYVQADTFQGLPLVPFDAVTARFPPEEHDLFVALGYTQLNALRARKCAEAEALGYRLARYVSSRATVFPGFEPGPNAFILEDNTIQPFARVGRNVTLWSGNHIGHHATIEDDCFVSSHVVISGGVTVGPGSFLGVNATIRDHVTIGERCVIGAGTLILEDAAPFGVYAAAGTERSRVPSHRLRSL